VITAGEPAVPACFCVDSFNEGPISAFSVCPNVAIEGWPSGFGAQCSVVDMFVITFSLYRLAYLCLNARRAVSRLQHRPSIL